MVRYAAGDRVFCNIKDNKIVSVYEENIEYSQIFDILIIYGEGYIIYIPSYSSLKDIIYINKSNYSKYFLHKKFIDSNICFITDNNITGLHSKLDGMCCSDCGGFCLMAAPNREDKTFVCWSCNKYPTYM